MVNTPYSHYLYLSCRVPKVEDPLVVAEGQVEVGNTSLLDDLRPLRMLYLPRGAATTNNN
jgi:hypothetical protein